jgi:hypothetical protein
MKPVLLAMPLSLPEPVQPRECFVNFWNYMIAYRCPYCGGLIK